MLLNGTLGLFTSLDWLAALVKQILQAGQCLFSGGNRIFFHLDKSKRCLTNLHYAFF
jgi:hypothetical protein